MPTRAVPPPRGGLPDSRPTCESRSCEKENSVSGATAQGGGLYVGGGTVSLSAVDVSYNRATAYRDGGAIFIDHGQVTIDSSSVHHNQGFGNAQSGAGIKMGYTLFSFLKQ